MKTIALLLVLCIATCAFTEQFEDGLEYIAQVKVSGVEDITTLSKRGISLENAKVGNPTVEAYVTKDELKLLEELKLEYSAIPNPSQLAARSKRSVADEGVQYHNYDRLTGIYASKLHLLMSLQLSCMTPLPSTPT